MNQGHEGGNAVGDGGRAVGSNDDGPAGEPTDAKRLRLAIAAAGLRTWEIDLASATFTWSRDEGEAATELPPEQRRPADEVLEEDRPHVGEAVRRAIREDIDFDHEFRMRTPSGIRWILARAAVERDDTGAPQRLVGVALDVTDRHAVQDELRSSEAFLDSIIDNIPALVCVKEADSLEYVRVNRAFEEFVDRTSVEILGRGDDELFPERAKEYMQQDREVLESGSMSEFRGEVIIIEGHEPRLLDIRKVPILDEEGTPEFLLGIAQDVTTRRAAARDLEQARDDAQAANNAKSAFLSRMSHELRTPLNALLGFSQLLAMDDLTDDQQETLAFISRSGSELLNLIDDVLDITAFGTSALYVSTRPVEVALAIRSAVEDVLLEADRTDVTIQVKTDCEGIYVTADQRRLTQVLFHLIMNAVKFNRPTGWVTVSCERSGGTVSIAIRDTGVGIPLEAQDQMFAPFARVNPDQAHAKGSGVGLALARVLTQRMGGNLTAVSTKGVGSTFTIELPQSDSASDAETGSAADAHD